MKTTNAKLRSKESRRGLAISKEPHWAVAGDGVHIGLAKGKRRSTWIERRRIDGKYVATKIGVAEETDSEVGLTYGQAVVKIVDPSVKTTVAPFTVDEAIEHYKDHKDGVTHDTELRLDRISESIGLKKCDKLTKTELIKWRKAFVDARVENWRKTLVDAFIAEWRKETGKKKATVAIEHKAQEYANKQNSNDIERRAKETTNRVFTSLRAVLQMSFDDGKFTSTDFQKIKPFPNTGRARTDFLTEAEATSLLAAITCDAFRLIAGASLFSGGRYGELCAARVKDFSAKTGTITFTETKSRKIRHTPLTGEGIALFTMACEGKKRNDLIFVHKDGSPWGKSHQIRLMNEAVDAADLGQRFTFHDLRRSAGSWLAEAGVSLQVIAGFLGHADIRVTFKHYAHIRPSKERELIISNMPKLRVFGAKLPRARKKLSANSS